MESDDEAESSVGYFVGSSNRLLKTIMSYVAFEDLKRCLSVSLRFSRAAAKTLANNQFVIIDDVTSNPFLRKETVARFANGTASYKPTDVRKVWIQDTLFVFHLDRIPLERIRKMVLGQQMSSLGDAVPYGTGHIEHLQRFVKRQEKLESLYVYPRDKMSLKSALVPLLQSIKGPLKELTLPGVACYADICEYVPKSVENMRVGGMSASMNTDGRYDRPDLFPPNLTKFKVNACSDALIDGRLPDTLTHLDLWFHYCGTLDHPPKDLKVLVVSPEFNQSLEHLPDSLVVLIFRKDAVYCKHIERLPRSLRVVYFCGFIPYQDYARGVFVNVHPLESSFTERNVEVRYTDPAFGRIPLKYTF